MKHLLTSLLASCLLALPASAMETRFSAMVSDIDTGLILTADRIDSPRDPSLLGRLQTLSMALQDLSDGEIQPQEVIRIGKTSQTTVENALVMTALGERDGRANMTGLVNRIGQNARVFGLRLDAISDMAGLQATDMRVVRGDDGGPAFDGYSTPRDMVRMATSVSRAFPDDVSKVFDPATGNLQSTHIWLYEDGMCMLSADGPTSGRPLIALLTGAPDQDTCLEAAAEMIMRDDLRIIEARHARHR